MSHIHTDNTNEMIMHEIISSMFVSIFIQFLDNETLRCVILYVRDKSRQGDQKWRINSFLARHKVQSRGAFIFGRHYSKQLTFEVHIFSVCVTLGIKPMSIDDVNTMFQEFSYKSIGW